MERIFESAGVEYDFMDRDGSVCCGRPLTLAGRKDREARGLSRAQYRAYMEVRCHHTGYFLPICYRIFTESYHLDIGVMHHSQYINWLIEQKELNLNFLNRSVVYHDPCELGRGCRDL
ncbi:MAG: (Fe-S)-binding protein [Bacteroidales bacterium]